MGMLGCIVGYSCKTHICSKDNDERIAAIEDEIDDIEIRNYHIMKNMENPVNAEPINVAVVEDLPPPPSA